MNPYDAPEPRKLKASLEPAEERKASPTLAPVDLDVPEVPPLPPADDPTSPPPPPRLVAPVDPGFADADLLRPVGRESADATDPTIPFELPRPRGGPVQAERLGPSDLAWLDDGPEVPLSAPLAAEAAAPAEPPAPEPLDLGSEAHAAAEAARPAAAAPDDARDGADDAPADDAPADDAPGDAGLGIGTVGDSLGFDLDDPGLRTDFDGDADPDDWSEELDYRPRSDRTMVLGMVGVAVVIVFLGLCAGGFTALRGILAAAGDSTAVAASGMRPEPVLVPEPEIEPAVAPVPEPEAAPEPVAEPEPVEPEPIAPAPAPVAPTAKPVARPKPKPVARPKPMTRPKPVPAPQPGPLTRPAPKPAPEPSSPWGAIDQNAPAPAPAPAPEGSPWDTPD